MVASTSIFVAQRGQRSTSNPKVRFIRTAQSRYLALANSSPSLSRPQWATVIVVGSGVRLAGSAPVAHARVPVTPLVGPADYPLAVPPPNTSMFTLQPVIAFLTNLGTPIIIAETRQTIRISCAWLAIRGAGLLGDGHRRLFVTDAADPQHRGDTAHQRSSSKQDAPRECHGAMASMAEGAGTGRNGRSLAGLEEPIRGGTEQPPVHTARLAGARTPSAGPS
jgi:hypothetical protein